MAGRPNDGSVCLVVATCLDDLPHCRRAHYRRRDPQSRTLAATLYYDFPHPTPRPILTRTTIGYLIHVRSLRSLFASLPSVRRLERILGYLRSGVRTVLGIPSRSGESRSHTTRPCHGTTCLGIQGHFVRLGGVQLSSALKCFRVRTQSKWPLRGPGLLVSAQGITTLRSCNLQFRQTHGMECLITLKRCRWRGHGAGNARHCLRTWNCNSSHLILHRRVIPKNLGRCW